MFELNGVRIKNGKIVMGSVSKMHKMKSSEWWKLDLWSYSLNYLNSKTFQIQFPASFVFLFSGKDLFVDFIHQNILIKMLAHFFNITNFDESVLDNIVLLKLMAKTEKFINFFMENENFNWRLLIYLQSKFCNGRKIAPNQ